VQSRLVGVVYRDAGALRGFRQLSAPVPEYAT
jgi:hypothetical protein